MIATARVHGFGKQFVSNVPVTAPLLLDEAIEDLLLNIFALFWGSHSSVDLLVVVEAVYVSKEAAFRINCDFTSVCSEKWY